MPITKQVSTNARRFPIHWLILGLALLALGGVISYSIVHEHSQIDALEQDRLATQAKVVDTNLEHQLVSLNMALVSIRNDLPYWKAQKDSKTLINRHLQAMCNAMPGVRTLLITDAEGTVFASNRKELIGMNFREREYFRAAHQGLNQDMLYISPPFTTVLGVFALNAVKVVLDAQGRFAGIVSSTLDPEYCTVLLNSVLYTPGMRASLIHGDGKIFVEVPGRKDLAGMDLAKPGSRYTLHKESGREANIFTTGRAFTTGDYRMSAWRTIRPASLRMDKPLMVSVNRDMQGIFASWRREALQQCGLFGVLVLAAVFGLCFYQWRQQKYDRLAAGYMVELQKSEENYRSLFQNASIGIFHSLPEGKFLRVNPALAQMLGYVSPEEMISAITNISTQIYLDSKKRSDIIAATLEKAGWVYAENRYRRKDGAILTANLAVRKILNPDSTVAYLEGFVEDITERKQAEEKIQASLREKETMLKEIHHRVKNNLQVISSLLGLQSSYLQDEKSREILQESQERVRIMAQIHTMLYQSEDLARVDFGGFVRDLVGRLQQSYRTAGSSIEVHVDTADVSLDIETSIPCGLILNELVSNALKHAFPEGRGGEVNISMAMVGDRFVLKVQDNGIGIPESVDFQNPRSLGLELVNLLVGQMNGTIGLQVKGGTTFTITFPTVSKGG